MFKLNGKSFTLDEVEEVATQSNLSVQDYVSQTGLEEEEDEVLFESYKTNGTHPPAPPDR